MKVKPTMNAKQLIIIGSALSIYTAFWEIINLPMNAYYMSIGLLMAGIFGLLFEQINKTCKKGDRK